MENIFAIWSKPLSSTYISIAKKKKVDSKLPPYFRDILLSIPLNIKLSGDTSNKTGLLENIENVLSERVNGCKSLEEIAKLTYDLCSIYLFPSSWHINPNTSNLNNLKQYCVKMLDNEDFKSSVNSFLILSYLYTNHAVINSKGSIPINTIKGIPSSISVNKHDILSRIETRNTSSSDYVPYIYEPLSGTTLDKKINIPNKYDLSIIVGLFRSVSNIQNPFLWQSDFDGKCSGRKFTIKSFKDFIENFNPLFYKLSSRNILDKAGWHFHTYFMERILNINFLNKLNTISSINNYYIIRLLSVYPLLDFRLMLLNKLNNDRKILHSETDIQEILENHIFFTLPLMNVIFHMLVYISQRAANNNQKFSITLENQPALDILIKEHNTFFEFKPNEITICHLYPSNMSKNYFENVNCIYAWVSYFFNITSKINITSDLYYYKRSMSFDFYSYIIDKYNIESLKPDGIIR
ncbi:hypothetical protein [Pectinatus frisingensis]|uniref:hypothetical protein n=1 Tax=Pectinatus frisingensis TaxID=865 RepID=UPI0015F62235|nr:hypothetical protein [Pectinatus frisingensis]